MSIAAVKERLLTKLQGLSTVADVRGYNASVWDNYPGGSLTVASGKAFFASTHHNKRVRQFSFKVFVDRTVWDEKQAEDISVSVLDEVETALDRDTTLSGLVAYCAPVSWSTSFAVREFDVKILDLAIEAIEIVQV